MIYPSLGLCLAISSLSIQSVCNQNIASNIIKKNTRVSIIMLSCLKITLLSSSLVSIFILFSFPIYKYIYNDSFIYYPLLLCIPLLFFSNTSGVMKGYLEANNEFNIYYLSNVIESIVKMALTITLLIILKNHSINLQVLMVFLSLTLSEFSSCIYLSFKIKKRGRPRWIKTNSFEINILKQAIPLTLSSLIQTVSSYITPFLLFFVCQKNGISYLESSTYYTLVVSYAIPLLTHGEFGVLSIARLAFPSITKKANTNEEKELLNILFFIAIPVTIVCFSICEYQGDTFLYLMYGHTLGGEIVKKLAFVYLIIYFDPLLAYILQAHKKEKEILIITIIKELITILAIYLLVNNIGVTGYIYGLAIGSLSKSIISLIISLKLTKFKLKYFSFILLSLLSLAYIYFAQKYSSIILFFTTASIYSLLALLIFYFFYSNTLKHHFDMMHT